jgi:hypothetical protein
MICLYTRFVPYALTLGISVTGTCRDNSAVIQELLDLKKSDKRIITVGDDILNAYGRHEGLSHRLERPSVRLNDVLSLVR